MIFYLNMLFTVTGNLQNNFLSDILFFILKFNHTHDLDYNHFTLNHQILILYLRIFEMDYWEKKLQITTALDSLVFFLIFFTISYNKMYLI